MRISNIERKTAETDIKLTLNLDGKGESEINSGCGFLDHMLTLLSKHARVDLKLTCKGDVEVDYHHTVEDIGISLGMAFKEALSDKRGITRYGNMILPMDESLVLSAVDLSGRCYLQYDLGELCEKVGDFDTELVEEFWLGFCRAAECTLHIKKLSGSNTHHIIEGAFKSVARTLRAAVKIDADASSEIPSTKGVL